MAVNGVQYGQQGPSASVIDIPLTTSERIKAGLTNVDRLANEDEGEPENDSEPTQACHQGPQCEQTDTIPKAQSVEQREGSELTDGHAATEQLPHEMQPPTNAPEYQNFEFQAQQALQKTESLESVDDLAKSCATLAREGSRAVENVYADIAQEASQHDDEQQCDKKAPPVTACDSVQSDMTVFEINIDDAIGDEPEKAPQLPNTPPPSLPASLVQQPDEEQYANLDVAAQQACTKPKNPDSEGNSGPCAPPAPSPPSSMKESKKLTKLTSSHSLRMDAAKLVNIFSKLFPGDKHSGLKDAGEKGTKKQKAKRSNTMSISTQEVRDVAKLAPPAHSKPTLTSESTRPPDEPHQLDDVETRRDSVSAQESQKQVSDRTASRHAKSRSELASAPSPTPSVTQRFGTTPLTPIAQKFSPKSARNKLTVAADIAPESARVAMETAKRYLIIAAVDFGTAYSGYAFTFVHDEQHQIHVMRKWEGGDAGILNQKTLTAVLLDPAGQFHSFGFSARDFYHDLDAEEAKKWLYFDNFKMALYDESNIGESTSLRAANGRHWPAKAIFTHALRYFRNHVLQELNEQSDIAVTNEDIRWVLTVPAIWSVGAKQFMREAAYEAGCADAQDPERLLIALEPEAASIHCRQLRQYQLVPEVPPELAPLLTVTEIKMPTPKAVTQSETELTFAAVMNDLPPIDVPLPKHVRAGSSPNLLQSADGAKLQLAATDESVASKKVEDEILRTGAKYLVLDCGGGTVDITVHELVAAQDESTQIRELYKATGGPFGSHNVDLEFQRLLCEIFTSDFIDAFKRKHPAAFVDLMVAFESRKRASAPHKKQQYLNVSLPFSFIDFHRKERRIEVEVAIRKFGNPNVRWSAQGMLRLTCDAMFELFKPTLESIQKAVSRIFDSPLAKEVGYIFLVGGFAESGWVQQGIRKAFEPSLKVIVPQDASLAVLKGAVRFGLDPTVITARRSRFTYGIGVLNRYDPARHPRSKLVVRDGIDWCTDVFEKYVTVNQLIVVGESIARLYTPAKRDQKFVIINFYAAEQADPQFVTDAGVTKCGALVLDLDDLLEDTQNATGSARPSSSASETAPSNAPESAGTLQQQVDKDCASQSSSNKDGSFHNEHGANDATASPRRTCRIREIEAKMSFGDTEIKVTATDAQTGKTVKAAFDFCSR